MKKRMVSVRMHPADYEWFVGEARRTGMSLGETIREALKAYRMRKTGDRYAPSSAHMSGERGELGSELLSHDPLLVPQDPGSDIAGSGWED